MIQPTDRGDGTDVAPTPDPAVPGPPPADAGEAPAAGSTDGTIGAPAPVGDPDTAPVADSGPPAVPGAAPGSSPVPGAAAVPGAGSGAVPVPGAAPGTSPAPVPDGAEAPARGRRGRRTLRGPGLRERRRQQTRARIVDAAAELFAERGFDTVSVVEIAQRAGVVEKTVFNHFPVKEGLVFEADPPMRAALLDAVRHRPAGESVAAAAGSFVVAAMSGLGSEEAATGVAEMAAVIRGSRTLQVREREILGELTSALAGLVAEETAAEPGSLEPWLAAHAVLGLYAGLLELARDRVLAGVTGPALCAELLARGEKGLALLQFGLAGYAKRR
ncbi:transcriptional regulator, TetR family [Trujillonella endophytica]|uniref:Transcriptional regulator, TetR family n=1 Tax=Trujillonella endophytica TaxID=673521 RepID=A0A1H8T7P4_9ACTN|nr:transcriptional regulator, TetR family [Trujillella endophytica]